MLGICLGAQIIGESLGAKTEQSPHKEIGVYPIQLTADGKQDPILKQFPASFDVMHWHNDMPGLAAGSTILAYSEGCPRQMIRYTDRVYGLQCHMEMTAELVSGMLQHCAADLKPGKYIQEATAMKAANLSAINEKMIVILNQLILIAQKQAQTRLG